MKTGASGRKLTIKITVVSLFALLVFSGPSSMIPALADPPLPDPGPVLPNVFCIRIMDIQQINADTYDIEFEFLNWSDTAINKIELDITNPNLGNIEFTATSIDADDRPLVFVDVDNDGQFLPGDLGDLEDTNSNGILDGGEDKNGNDRLDNDPAPGNLTPVNDWTTGPLTATEAVFNAGTPIPFIDLLGATTTGAANALLPGNPTVDVNGVVDPPEAIDDGTNVLGGFVIRVTGFDSGETFSMNWHTFDSNGDPIGTPQGGNSMGYGLITLSYQNTPGPLPGSPFIGFPNLQQNPRDFFDSVYNVNPTFSASPAPMNQAFGNGVGQGSEFPPGDYGYFNTGQEGWPLEGHLHVSNAVCNGVGDPDHCPFLVGEIPQNLGCMREHDGVGQKQKCFNFDNPWGGAAEGTGERDSTNSPGVNFNLLSPPQGGFGSTVTLIGNVDDPSGLGSGTIRFTGGAIPPTPNFVEFNVDLRSPPTCMRVETIPDENPGFGNGDGVRVFFTFDTSEDDMFFVDSFFDVFFEIDQSPVDFGSGATTSTWIDPRTVELIFPDTSGNNVGLPGGIIFLPNGNPSFTSADSAVDVSSIFQCPAITGFWQAPSSILQCPIDTTPSMTTTIVDDCDIFSDVTAGGNVDVENARITIHSPAAFKVDLDNFHLSLDAFASLYVNDGAAFGDTDAFTP